MTTPNTTIRKVILNAAGGTDRVWDIPYSMPIRDLTIFVSSMGKILPAGGVVWNVYYGGTWSGGKPFEDGSTLKGGVSKANGAFGAVEVADTIHKETGLFPPNKRLVKIPDFNGPAVSVGLVNNTASQLTLVVFFVSRFLGDFS